MNQEFILTGSGDAPIRGNIEAPASDGPHPAIIICHGFKGFKDWGFFPWISGQLVDQGFAAIRFNFSHSGVGEVPLEFTELDRFAKDTPVKQAHDLGVILDWANSQPFIDPQRIGVLGHSRGGATALIRTASDKDDRVRTLVTWASPSRLDLYPDMVKEQWRKYGYLPFLNARTGQEMRVNVTYLECLEEQPERFDLPRRVAESVVPMLFVHGSHDESVPPECAEELAGWNPSPLRALYAVQGGTHTFSAVHPFAGATPQLEEAFQATLQWFKQYLG